MADNPLHPLTVVGVQQGEERESPLLLLEDDLGRTVEIPIGICEALAIQRVLDGQQSVRPLTHDLMLVLAERLEAPLSRAIIDDVSGGTYYARIILNAPEGPITLDCRPSDAVAFALRARAPILAGNTVMENEKHEGR